MKEFFRSLSKLIQGLLDKIRNPKKKEYESVLSIFGTIDTGTKAFNKIDDKGLVMIPSHAEVNFELIHNEDDLINSLEKNFNISLTFLPKRYSVKTLILTLAANQKCDYQAVDLSQYEERGLAHYIVGSTKSPQELEGEYDNEEEGDPLWSEVDGIAMCSAVIGSATLLHYEDLNIWEVEYD